MLSFEQLNLVSPILMALKEEGYTQPTPIQRQAIPILLDRKDLLGCAQTGTGKTAAFAIPVLQLLMETPAPTNVRKPIRALVLTPTRELAIQIAESFTAYGRHTGLNNVVVFGGVSQKPQTDALRNGVDVLVATPGRLLDLIQQRHINLQNVEFFVLDEADRMLDMGFVHDVKRIIALLPAKRQSLFFSATMPPEIVQLSAKILTRPEKVEVTPVSSTAEKVSQTVYFVEKAEKRPLLVHLLKDESITTTLVFTRTKHGADRVTRDLVRAGVRAEAIHGDKSQNARQRALGNFKAKKTRVLVATDIAARGIDVDELTHVINYDIPNIPETYVHRIGRTGRAGASGQAISFCDREERAYLRDIQKLIKMVPTVQDHPFADGTAVAEPSEKRQRPQNGGGGQGRNRGGQGRNGNSRNGNSRNAGSRNGKPRNGNSRSGKPSGGQGRTNAAPAAEVVVAAAPAAKPKRNWFGLRSKA
jgi:ATP-dependent RNA helicase RhlE